MVNKVDAGENISALVDGELEHHEINDMIQELRDDVHMLRSWERYHLISDVLRKNLASHLSPDFCQQVSLAIEQEPTVLAPQRHSLRLSPFMRQVAGLGIAASVTAVAILGTQYYIGGSGVTAAPMAQNQSAPTDAQFARIAIPESPQPIPSNVNRYLVNHNQHAAGVQGVLPYARIIGYRPESPEK